MAYFGAILMATVLAAPHTRLGNFIKAHDPLALVPVWTFFAPTPGVDDLRILYRDRLFDGARSEWCEIEPPRNRWVHVVWNPDKRVRKAVVDACSELLAVLPDSSKTELSSRLILLSPPYLLLLNYIQAQRRDFRSEARQFMITRSSGSATLDDSAILFVSIPHTLKPIVRRRNASR